MKQLDIKDFKYYKLINSEAAKEKTSRSITDKDNNRSSGSGKLANILATKNVNRFMHMLAISDDPEDKILLKQLKLEKEYIRALEKRELSIQIEIKTGTQAGGAYTLAEIGDVLGLTRERVRQLEASAIKVLKHPSSGRIFKTYQED